MSSKLLCPTWHLSLGYLIDKLDHPDFWRSLVEVLNDSVPVDNWVALIFSGTSPHILNYRERTIAGLNYEPVVVEYVSGLYLLDPFYISNRHNKESGFFHLLEVAPEYFLQTEYYNLYFTHYVGSDEVQYNVKLDGDRALCLSLGSESPFTTEQIAMLEQVQPWVIALMAKRVSFENDMNNNAPITSSLDAEMMRLGMPLTARELDVAKLILSGFSNKEAANRLSLSPETVKVHRRHLYSKLNVRSQSELFILYFKNAGLNTA